MPFVTAADSVVHEMHGVRFVSYAAPALGSRELCAWRLELEPGSGGPEHRISHEEVFTVLSGRVEISIDGETRAVGPGDAVIAPPGSSVGVANRTEEPAAAWVSTTVGLKATLADGSRISPPWAN